MAAGTWRVIAGIGAAFGLAAANAAPTCDIDVESRYGLYLVTVDGEAYKGKMYVTHDDAVRLRDVLIHSGHCLRARQLKRCAVRIVSKGKFKIQRGGADFFQPKVTFASVGDARVQAKRLAQVELCTFDPKAAPAGQMTSLSLPASSDEGSAAFD